MKSASEQEVDSLLLGSFNQIGFSGCVKGLLPHGSTHRPAGQQFQTHRAPSFRGRPHARRGLEDARALAWFAAEEESSEVLSEG